jgi:hypothetical protein
LAELVIGENGTPETPDWSPCPHDCAIFDLADYARRKVETSAGDTIPANIVLSDN